MTNRVRAKAFRKRRLLVDLLSRGAYATGSTTCQRFIVEMPIDLVSEANTREHHMKRAARASAQRSNARMYLQQVIRSTGDVLPTLPLIVTLSRIAPRKLDTDNHVVSCKHVRDGIADYFGVNDRDEDKIKWLYGEQVRDDAYGVMVEIKKQ